MCKMYIYKRNPKAGSVRVSNSHDPIPSKGKEERERGGERKKKKERTDLGWTDRIINDFALHPHY